MQGIAIRKEPTIVIKEGTHVLESNLSVIDFGTVQKDSFVIKKIGLGNNGLSPLSVKLRLNTFNGFSIENNVVDENLSFGNSVVFTIKFSPLYAERAEDSLVISSNDPDQEDFIIKLAGIGTGFTSFGNILENEVKVFSIPDEELLCIESTNAVSIDIYNMVGLKVSHLKNIQGLGQINLSYLEAGIYLIRVTDGKNQFTKKLVID